MLCTYILPLWGGNAPRGRDPLDGRAANLLHFHTETEEIVLEVVQDVFQRFTLIYMTHGLATIEQFRTLTALLCCKSVEEWSSVVSHVGYYWKFQDSVFAPIWASESSLNSGPIVWSQ